MVNGLFNALCQNEDVQQYVISKLFYNVDNLNRFKSPFRKDTHPSCGIFKRGKVYFFKDFGTGVTKPVLYLYKQIYGLSTIDVLREWMYGSNKVKRIKPIKIASIRREYTKADIRYITKPFNNVHIKFFRKFRINPNITSLFRCHGLAYYSFGYNPAIRTEDPTFIYIYSSRKVKIYSPDKKLVNNSKFISNTKKTDIFHVHRSSSTVVFCTSIKDAMALYSNVEGYYDVVIPPSESSIDERLFKIIYYYRNRVLVPDNDNTGMNLFHRIKHHFTHHIIPSFKDIADDAMYGLTDKYKMINRLV